MQTSARLACFIAAVGLSIFSGSAGTAAAKTIFLNNSSGGDGAGCGGPSVQACKTLQFAATSATAGDTLLMVNPGDYGPATIDKSLTIEGGIAGVGVFSPQNGPCVTITAGAGNEIVIHDFICDQTSQGENGIVLGSAATLNLDHVVITGHHVGNDGIRIFPASGKANLLARDSTVEGFDTAVFVGRGSTGLLRSVTVEDNDFGVLAGGAAQITLEDCRVSLSGLSGIQADGTKTTVNVRNSLITLNAHALVETSGGILISLGGNSLAGNTVDGSFTKEVNPK